MDSETRIEADEIGIRLDVWCVAQGDNLTRVEAQRLIELPEEADLGIRVNGKRSKSNYKLRANDSVSVARPAVIATEIKAENIPLTIVFEDEDMLVIDKPRGMVVHPAPGSPHGTLVNAVLAHAEDLSGIGGESRPGIVHRLDKDTGGLLMVAKNDFAHRHLQAQIQDRTAERRYWAIVWGLPQFRTATVEAPIGRHPSNRKRMAVVTDPRYTSRDAVTELTVKDAYGSMFTLLEAKLQTGRTHQIRVHCAYIHHPVVGDTTYAGTKKVPGDLMGGESKRRIERAIDALGGQALHAVFLAFNHPRTEERMEFTVSPAPVMLDLIETLQAAFGKEK